MTAGPNVRISEVQSHGNDALAERAVAALVSKGLMIEVREAGIEDKIGQMIATAGPKARVNEARNLAIAALAERAVVALPAWVEALLPHASDRAPGLGAGRRKEVPKMRLCSS